MVANEVNKFGQIFPIHRPRKYKNIGEIKIHLRRINLVSGILHIFFQI
jgi:hypothetical protein